MDQITLHAMNSPLVVVVILALVFGFLMMGLRELLWFVKSLKKTTPTDKMSETFSELGTTLKLLNQQIQDHQKLTQQEHGEILKGIDRIERKL